MDLKYDIASILARETPSTIANWYGLVEQEPSLTAIKLTREQRCAHLPGIFADLVYRLHNPLPLGSRALMSSSAVEHGCLRRDQGYTAAMMVDESRALQVSIFETLNKNTDCINFSLLLGSVMTIADEVDSQLSQAMTSYRDEAVVDLLPM